MFHSNFVAKCYSIGDPRTSLRLIISVSVMIRLPPHWKNTTSFPLLFEESSEPRWCFFRWGQQFVSAGDITRHSRQGMSLSQHPFGSVLQLPGSGKMGCWLFIQRQAWTIYPAVQHFFHTKSVSLLLLWLFLLFSVLIPCFKAYQILFFFTSWFFDQQT